eukprot:750778-Amphidinium_carterae.1
MSEGDVVELERSAWPFVCVLETAEDGELGATCDDLTAALAQVMCAAKDSTASGHDWTVKASGVLNGSDTWGGVALSGSKLDSVVTQSPQKWYGQFCTDG